MLADKTPEGALASFFAQPFKNAYVTAGPVTAYLRKSARYDQASRDYFTCLDIASISVATVKRRQGYCTRFIKASQLMGLPVFVECAHNPQVQRLCLRLGFVRLLGEDNNFLWRPTT